MRVKRKRLIAAVVAAVIGTGVVVTVNVTSTSTCRTIPASVDRTGKTDVTARLNSVFTSLKPGQCLRFPRSTSAKPVFFRVSGQLKLDHKENIDIFGNGSTISIRNHIHGPLIFVTFSKDILIQNLRLVGAEKDCIDTVEKDPAEEFEAGLQVQWSEDITINRMNIRRVPGESVFIGWGTQPNGGWADGQIPPGSITPENPNGVPVVVPKSYNIVVTNNTFFCMGRQGMALAHVDGVRIENNSFHRVALTGIDLEHFAVDNLVIRGNRFGHVRQWMFIGQVPGDNWYFGHNVSDEPIYALVRHANPKNVTFEYNTGGGVGGNPYEVWGPGVPFLVVRSSGEFRVVGNSQKFAPWIDALEFTQPYKYNVPGTSLNAIGGTCLVYAEGNNFAGAQALWRPPATFPPGCSWVDGGGNLLK